MIQRTKLISIFAGAAVLAGASLSTASPAQAYCGYYGCSYGYGDAALAAGIVGGLAVGAIAASAAHQASVDRAANRRAYRSSQRRSPPKAKVQQVQAN